VIEQRDGDTRRDCLGAETVASYVDGTLPASERESVELHLAGCADCRELLTEAFAATAALDAEGIAAEEFPAATAEEAESPPRRPSDPVRLVDGAGPRQAGFSRRLQLAGGALLALAAAALFVIALDPSWLRDLRRGGGASPELRELVAAVGGNRLVEPRLSGGFAWGPPPPVLRSGNAERPLTPDVQIAIARVEKAAGADPAPANLHALGAAQLLGGDVDAAIASLRRAADARPEQARIWNDLAAAYLTRAGRRPVEGDVANAIVAAERATDVEATLAEAWFNLALARDAAGQTAQAQEAWRRAAALEPATSGWHDEAIRRMQPAP
jgi:tetratricopeptide (TPR) repeat protein